MTLGLSPVPPRAQPAYIIPQDRPVYKVLDGKFFDGEELHQSGSILVWREEPTVEMEPLNDLAEIEVKKLYEKLDTEGRKVAEKTGKAYNSLADAYENSHALAQQESRRVEVLNAPKHVPLMGGKKRGRPRTEKLDLTGATATPKDKGKRILNDALSNSLSKKVQEE